MDDSDIGSHERVISEWFLRISSPNEHLHRSVMSDT